MKTTSESRKAVKSCSNEGLFVVTEDRGFAMILPSHVAILVPSVRKAADHLQQFDFQIDKEKCGMAKARKNLC